MWLSKARALPPLPFQLAEAGQSEPLAALPFDPVKGGAFEIRMFSEDITVPFDRS
ncbi:MAG: hypothetical protein WDN49_24995 [Acetobacteraceae bacterium]